MEKQFCEYCGNKLQDDDVICSNCGAKITNNRSATMKKKILIGLLCIVCIVCIGVLVETSQDDDIYTDFDNGNQSSGITLDEKIATVLYKHLGVVNGYDIEKTTYSVESITETANGTYDVIGYYVMYRKISNEPTREIEFEMNVNLTGESYCKSIWDSGYY